MHPLFLCINELRDLAKNPLPIFRQNEDKNCTKKGGRLPFHPETLYDCRMTPTFAKVVNSIEKSKSPFILDHLIHHPARTDALRPGDGIEIVPGVPVYGDGDLHPLLLRIYGFATSSRSRTASVVLHISPPYRCDSHHLSKSSKRGFHSLT